MVQALMIDTPKLVAQTVLEFYATGNDIRRRELQNLLDQFQDGPDSWRLAIELVDQSKQINVQFYGAKVLYHIIGRHFNRLAENIDSVSMLKNFYIQILTSRAHSLPHSVLNKLSSGLAILVLNSLPDIWPHPFHDLILLWSNQLELLLRVLAEIAAEFHRLSMSLNQRNEVKAKLQNTEINVVQIAQHVLEDADSPASLRNAAVECVELWLKLPNAKLDDYMGVFNSIFSNVGNDFPALARILCTVKSNEEFERLPKLIWQITEFVANNVCPRVEEELNLLAAQGKDQLLAGMEELIPLISVLVEFCHDFVRHIVRQVCASREDNALAVYISDLPEPWWCSLREELLQPDEGSTWSVNKQRLKEESAKWYLDMAESVIGKLTLSPQLAHQLDKESLEKFESYRVVRSDVSLNSVQLSPMETVRMLAVNLNTSLDAYDPDRAEAVLHLLKEAADFINESHLPMLLPALQKCGPLEHWLPRVPLTRLDRFARALLNLFGAIEHLLLTSTAAADVLPHLMHTVLSCLQLSALDCGVDELALNTLIVALRYKDTSLKKRVDLFDAIIQRCYAHFTLAHLPMNSRLLAMRCVGIGLSFKQPEFIRTSLNQILAPRLTELDKMASNLSITLQHEDKILFELSILAQLVSTLESTVSKQQQIQVFPIIPYGTAEHQPQDSPVRLIIDQTLPLFNKLLANHTPSSNLIAKLCEVLKATVLSLYTQIAPLLDTILCFIDTIIVVHSAPACELAKSVFLTFHKERAEASKLMNHLAKWYIDRWGCLQRYDNITEQIDAVGDQDEHLLTLSYHVLRKCWDNMLHATTIDQQSAIYVHDFIQCQCCIISTVLCHSRNVALIQDALRLLNFLLKQAAATDNTVLSSAVASVIERMATAVFLSVYSELTTGNVNLIADILHNMTSSYPAQIRATICSLPGGDSQLVTAMLSNVNVKNFRLRCAQIHQASLLQRVPPDE